MSPLETIGADLGGTKMLIGVVDSDQRVLHESSAPTHGLTPDQLLDALEAQLKAALAARPEAAGVGVGVPATMDWRRGIAISAVNLPLVDVPIRDVIAERIGIPVFVDNDANVAAQAEHRFGAARGTTNLVLVTIGTGIGGGLILEGKPYRGSIGAGAELGHVVIDENGPRCQGNCPNRGCVEALSSGTALAREGRLAAVDAPDSVLGRALAESHEVSGKTVTDAALAGDEVARGVVAEAGRHLGVAFATYANIFDPDMIVVGGGVMAVGDLMLDPARDELGKRALPPMNRTPVVLAELGPEAGMVGAAAMAMAELEESEVTPASRAET
jgi:glucokinase